MIENPVYQETHCEKVSDGSLRLTEQTSYSLRSLTDFSYLSSRLLSASFPGPPRTDQQTKSLNSVEEGLNDLAVDLSSHITEGNLTILNCPPSGVRLYRPHDVIFAFDSDQS